MIFFNGNHLVNGDKIPANVKKGQDDDCPDLLH